MAGGESGSELRSLYFSSWTLSLTSHRPGDLKSQTYENPSARRDVSNHLSTMHASPVTDKGTMACRREGMG
jgi:hypothetical protein